MRFKLVGPAVIVLGCCGAAVAADLPIPEPVEHVRICNAFGKAYFYIPGSDTCLKLSGYVRTELHYVDGDTDVLLPGGAKSEFNNWTSRARGNVTWEARTFTELGLIRTFIEMQGTRGPVDYVQTYPEDFEIPNAFIEVTGDHGIFTAGRTSSFFDFYGSDDYGTRIDVDDSTTEQNLFAYSVTSLLGLKGTISIEDPDSSGRRLTGTDDYEGLELPDLVGSIKYESEDETKSAQLSGVLRHIHDVNGDGVGWAASAGFALPVATTKLGFSTQFGYSDGAIAYLTNDPGGIGDFSGPDGDDTNQAWMARGGFLAKFTDKVSAWLNGSFTHVEDDDDDYDFWAVVGGAKYKPYDSLSYGPEFAYNRIDGDDPGEDGDVWGLMWRFEARLHPVED